MEVALGFFEEDNGIEYDLSKPPMSGIDYLKRVQQEAAGCPDVVIVKRPVPKIEREQTVSDSTSQIHENSVYDNALFPPESSQLRVTEDFAYLRQRFNRAKTDPSLYVIHKSLTLPQVGSSQVYARFCYGKDFAKEFTDASLKGVKGQLLNTGAQGQGNAPLLSILLKLKQSQVIRLLKFNSNWLDVVGFSYDQGCWIHGLLLCLDKPVMSEPASILRDLCRRVMAIRKDLIERDESLIHQLDLLIILVTSYFRQTDLIQNGF